MPKRNDLDSILVIGAGAIVIGQACEFDYSGTQACMALKQEGYRVILINPNPASIMTDPEVADVTYVEPITTEILEKIIAKERPDALLSTMGGQTSLNAVMKLHAAGVLERYQLEVIGANVDVIHRAEDRDAFRLCMQEIGLECPKSFVVKSKEEALECLDKLPLPIVIRPSFTLGGTGGGIATNRQQFEDMAASGLAASMVNSILIEEYLEGWKEFEMEVVRDRNDNCIIVCSIENLDPMGVHTGDSITVAPAQTLTDKELQTMRNASFAVLRAIGVDTGGANVQFAVNPHNGDLRVIEMNPRVSRSSALASKATGYPIAKIAARLAVGYTLDELKNDITRVTPASFEPSIDYVVTKVPRFAFEKFPGSRTTLSTVMRSVGEAMAIGRNFPESLQKALRSIESGYDGFDEQVFDSKEQCLRLLATPTPNRILHVANAIRNGVSLEDIHQASKIDPWFLREISSALESEKELSQSWTAATLTRAKSYGLSDKRIAKITKQSEQSVRQARKKWGILPRYRAVDTCAGELDATTSYLYGHYPQNLDGQIMSSPLLDEEWQAMKGKKVIIIGSGPNRIGQGIEFDYCCVHAAVGLRQAGYQVIMVNCNPETVSTDYDISDRLYFEPIITEDVLNIIEAEQQDGSCLGIILQFGGQSPLKLAKTLHDMKDGIPILGTPYESIDIAEDRERCLQLLTRLNLKQAPGAMATSLEEAHVHAQEIGYPLMVRPSYVLGGRAMRIVYNKSELDKHVQKALSVSEQAPILLDKYLEHSTEVDCDLLSDGTDVWIAGVMEHIEEAGIHSGDSACSLPPYSLSKDVVAEIRNAAIKIAHELNICGVLNIQFAVQGNEVYLIEINPRASRTLPFVAKASRIPVAALAARIMCGERLKDFPLPDQYETKHIAVKEAVFPFSRFPESGVRLGPEMRSTGEVMGIAETFPIAYAKAQMAAGLEFPSEGEEVFISVIDEDKPLFVKLARNLHNLGFKIVATQGTAAAIQAEKIPVQIVAKNQELGRTIIDKLLDQEVALILNTSSGEQAVKDSLMMHQLAIAKGILYVTTRNASIATVQALEELRIHPLVVRSLQNYNPQWKEVLNAKNIGNA